LLIKNIDKDVTQQEIYNLFKNYGNIVSAKLETYPDSKESRGFAYIQYEDEAQAEAALNAVNNYELKGKKLEVSKHNKKDKKKPESSAPVVVAKKNNLFVKSLPDGTDDAKLKDLFAEFGPIESAQVQKDTDGKLKDYGYVCFKEPAHAEAAIKAMDKKVIADGKFLIVNFHISKREGELN